MPANITIYLDPECLTSPLNWEGPDVYRFYSSLASDVICGVTEAGKVLHSMASDEELALLDPKGHIQEDALSKLNPEDLRNTLLNMYDRAARVLYFAEDADELLPGDLTGRTTFRELQRDIAGAVLICDRAIEKGCKVYWALW